MKLLVITFLILLGIYWLVDHASPLPLNHEAFGLYNHTIHRIMGLVFFAIAAMVAWKWHPKKSGQV